MRKQDRLPTWAHAGCAVPAGLRIRPGDRWGKCGICKRWGEVFYVEGWAPSPQNEPAEQLALL
jgi:hypothetical protein